MDSRGSSSWRTLIVCRQFHSNLIPTACRGGELILEVGGGINPANVAACLAPHASWTVPWVEMKGVDNGRPIGWSRVCKLLVEVQVVILDIDEEI